MSDLIAEKLDQVQGILNELDLDAWMVFVRESSHGGDQALSYIYEGSFTWQSALIVTSARDRIAVVRKFSTRTGGDNSSAGSPECRDPRRNAHEPQVDNCCRLVFH